MTIQILESGTTRRILSGCTLIVSSVTFFDIISMLRFEHKVFANASSPLLLQLTFHIFSHTSGHDLEDWKITCKRYNVFHLYYCVKSF